MPAGYSAPGPGCRRGAGLPDGEALAERTAKERQPAGNRAPAARPSALPRPVTSLRAAIAAAPPNAARVHEPMLIGEVGRKTRSMLAKRHGRPRSDTSSAGLTAAPAA